MTGELGSRPVVVSPHLDDGVFSLGATLAASARAGAEPRVLTVFANDAASQAEAGPWDRACGFATEGEAASARREEDRRACELVGARPTWLSFRDEEYAGERSGTAVWEALRPHLSGADSVLLPGFPLAHPDHRWLAELVLAQELPGVRVGLYVEQPYAAWRVIGRGRREWAAPELTLRRGLANAAAILFRSRAGRALQQPVTPDAVARLCPALSWTATKPSWGALRQKRRAVAAYRSQLAGFGTRTPSVMTVYELGWGGEGLAWRSPG
ncbi:MAG TPA: PIG-L family deacetylase [Gaiellaceae bacterium]|nr:PIG-L family deacetylase [Gaiellaceae bacterium]